MGRTDFLFARPSYLGGLASLMDIGGTLFLFNSFPKTAQADYWAIRSDWEMVGQDMKKATDLFAEELNEEEKAA